MIEGVEINIYMENGKDITFDLSPLQTETVLKSLGIKIDPHSNSMTQFADKTLRDLILPRINLKEI